MKKLIFILLMVGMCTSAYSQSTLIWSKNFAVEMDNFYIEKPRIQASEDTIQVVGRKYTDNGQRLLLVNYNLQGDTISTNVFGNDSVYNNTIVDYKFDDANHLYILNKEKMGFYKSKTVLQKYSLDGSLIWVQQIHAPGDTSFTPHSIGITNDTFIFITAYKEYDLPEEGDDVSSITTLSQLYNYSTTGTKLWYRTFDYNTELIGFACNLFVHNNTAYVFGGVTSGIIRLLKIDINNNMSINSNTGLLNRISNVQLTKDNNLLITARLRYRISKTNLNGAVIWSKDYGTNLASNHLGDDIFATIQDSVGNIYVTGRYYATSSFDDADILTIKYGPHGNLIWQNKYQYAGVNNSDYGNTIELKNGQVYVGGNSQRLGQGTDMDYLVLKIDSLSGLSTGAYRYDGLSSGSDAVSSLHVYNNGNVALTGLSFMNSKYNWTTQLISDVPPLSINDKKVENNFQIYPNPIASGEILKVSGNKLKSYSIMSSIGQIVQYGQLNSMSIQYIRTDNLPSGLYLLNLKSENEVVAHKIVVK